MDQHSFSTAFEKRIKPRIASDLGLVTLCQRFNVDYVTRSGNFVELKIRKFSEDKNGHGFVMNKNQYEKIKKRYLGQTFFDNDGGCHPAQFSYLLFGYASKSNVGSISTVDEVIVDMKPLKAFIMDHRFIGEYDKAGENSRFHRVRVDDLERSVKDKKEIRLLGRSIDLKLVANGEYVEPCRVESYL